MAKITEKIAALPTGSTFFSFEFFPPKTQAGTQNLLPRLTRLANLNPLFVTVTWGAGGSTATKSLELAEITQRQLGLTTCLHLTCTNMRKNVLDDALDRAKELGVKNILALRGDEPREGEYMIETASEKTSNDEEFKFTYAADLVRYIRERHGQYFCIGVAGYPEGHVVSSFPEAQSPLLDLPHLIAKTKAGADFIMTQLFYDVEAFLKYEKLLRGHESGMFKDIPIIPGLMPVQSWGILKRTTKLSCAKIPQAMLERLETVRSDDDAVKRVGVDILSEMVESIRQGVTQVKKDGDRTLPQGFHFYTLNLEKAVARISERSGLVSRRNIPIVNGAEESAVIDDRESSSLNSDRHVNGATDARRIDRRRLSSQNSGPRNRVVVTRPSDASGGGGVFEVSENEAGVPKEREPSRENTLAIAEGEGSLGREATWDDFPNGRWGDARSPAYGSIDGYGPSLHVSYTDALRLWGQPESNQDISALFRKYLGGELAAIPWSEEALSPETALISAQLLKLNDRGWWTMASQPAVNAAKSEDEIVGWGPKGSGFVWQKPFVELFISSQDWHKLRSRLDEDQDQISYFAGNANGDFVASDESGVNPVTWGAFKGQEIVTPTIIEAISFRAWQEEAFGIWREWQRIYHPSSVSAKLLREITDDVWLVNVIGHEYIQGDSLWDVLLA